LIEGAAVRPVEKKKKKNGKNLGGRKRVPERKGGSPRAGGSSSSGLEPRRERKQLTAGKKYLSRKEDPTKCYSSRPQVSMVGGKGEGTIRLATLTVEGRIVTKRKVLPLKNRYGVRRKRGKDFSGK